jgi:hypothetical protein
MAASSSNTPPDWKGLVEEYSAGASDVEIARLLNITITRFYQLIEENPAFAEFVERGRTLSRAWWEGTARKNLWNKEFNTALWNFNMKNRYGWADKVDTNDTTNKDPVNLDQAKSELAQAIARLSKKNPELLKGVYLNSKDPSASE